MTLAEAKSHLAALEEAIYSGVLTVRFSGSSEKQVTYQSLADLERAASRLRRAIATQGTGVTKALGSGRTLLHHERGTGMILRRRGVSL